jgi:hypothetical protein
MSGQRNAIVVFSPLLPQLTVTGYASGSGPDTHLHKEVAALQQQSSPRSLFLSANIRLQFGGGQ